jgi:hypothetical protein
MEGEGMNQRIRFYEPTASRENYEYEKLYYLRSGENNAPVITVSDLMRGDEVVARGVALCSPRDNPCKDTGRKRARVRAIIALYHRGQQLPVNFCFTSNIDLSLPRVGVFCPYKFKSEYRPTVVDHER